MKNNTKSIVITSLIILLLLIIGLIYRCTTSVEYSLYKVLNSFYTTDFLSEHISTKCKFTTYTDIPAADKPMFQYLLGVKELKKEIPCKQYMEDEDSVSSYILRGIAIHTNNAFSRQLLLLKFMLTKKIFIRKDTGDFLCGYKCRDNDTDEKVCTLINIIEEQDNLYFKKVNSKWLLINIDNNYSQQ